MVKECHYSGLIEFEFIEKDKQVYFLEINPRICGHIGQKDINKNSIYYNKIIKPYFKEYGIDLPYQFTTYKTFSGSSLQNVIPLIFNLNPILFITIGVIYFYLLILIIKKYNLRDIYNFILVTSSITVRIFNIFSLSAQIRLLQRLKQFALIPSNINLCIHQT